MVWGDWGIGDLVLDRIWVCVDIELVVPTHPLALPSFEVDHPPLHRHLTVIIQNTSHNNNIKHHHIMQHLRITHHANITSLSASSWVPALFFSIAASIAALLLCSSCSTYRKNIEKSVHHIEQHNDIMHDSITTSKSTSLHIEVFDFDPSMAEDMTKDMTKECDHVLARPSLVRYMVIDYADTTTTISRHDSIVTTMTTEDNKTISKQTRRTRPTFLWVGVGAVVVWAMRRRRR